MIRCIIMKVITNLAISHVFAAATWQELILLLVGVAQRFANEAAVLARNGPCSRKTIRAGIV